MRRALIFIALLAGTACGGSSVTDPANNNTPSGGTGKTLTATFTGGTFTPTTMSAVYAGTTVAIFGTDGRRSLQISAVNVPATGRYAFGVGSSSGSVFQWTDNDFFSSSFATNPGSVTFTVLQAGRVAGSFDVVVRNGTAATSTTVTITGTFDIRSP